MNQVLPPVALTNAVEQALNSVQPGERILVACSGGADSLALAWTAQFVANKNKFFLSAIVIDHQLFETSAEVALVAKQKLNELGITEVQIIQVDVVNKSEGIEAAARDARYQAFRSYGREISAKLILLGHTQEDQVETVLMRLTRGSGARSLQGMAQFKENFVRPFLHLSRGEVRDSLSSIGLVAWEDPMNYSDKFLRSKIRNQLLPKLVEVLGEGILDSIDKTALQIRDDNAALDLITRDVMALSQIETSGEVDILATQPKAIRTRILRLMMLNAGVPAASLANSHIEAVDQLIVNWHGQGEVALPGKLWASRKSGILAIKVKAN